MNEQIVLTKAKFVLANGKEVEASAEEICEFITVMHAGQLVQIFPNPYWRWSCLLTEAEWGRYLQGKSTQDELKKVARYIIVYMENQSLTGYLFDKSEGKPDQTKEFNMPVLKKLRDLYQKVIHVSHDMTELYHVVHEMENACMEIGADPL